DVGYVDDVLIALGGENMMIDTNWVVIETDTTYEYVIVNVDSSYNLMGAWWELPAAAEWTNWSLNWINPSGDIGGALTMRLDNDMTEAPYWITPDNPDFDFENAGWTFFDDFSYRAWNVGIQPVIVKDLHIYPNPAVDMLYLSLQIPLEKVEMYNVMGQRVKVLHHPDRKFNISDLSSGMYLIHATDEEGVIHEAKVIKK
ncbi:MAG: T9SS type A sorting domain-containing protein, partial [Bacteroidales bacterium]|nr:T9SS type A sorting domain-containing protein [Bacteroidales bacterium]